MKTTLTEHDFINGFMRVRPEQFSHCALGALWAYYMELEESTGEELEFDPIAIACDWKEYDTMREAAEAYGWDGAVESDDERADQNERKAQEWLQDQTTVLELPGDGCVVLQF